MEPPHPTTGGELSRLDRTLLRFRIVAHEASVMWRGFVAVGDATLVNSDLMFGLTNQAMMIVCKFLEIWDDTSTLARSEPRIVEMRRAVQPIVDRMRIWPGLDLMRNTGLAHAYLDKQGHVVRPFDLIEQGLSPTFHAEIILLMQLVVFGALGVLAPFEAEYTLIDSLSRSESPQLPRSAPGISEGSEISPEVNRLASLVSDKLKISFGIVGDTPLFIAFKSSLIPKPSAR